MELTARPAAEEPAVITVGSMLGLQANRQKTNRRNSKRAGVPLILAAQVFALAADAAQYRRHGKVYLNDLNATPGVAMTATTAVICAPDYARRVRRVPLSVKRLVCAEYAIPVSRCNGRNFEIDHLIPLELGGSNDIKNLWPQPLAEAREKDELEDWLHGQVCSGMVSIQDAQKAIARDWFAAWTQIRPRR
ncbi:MAG: HNH endonuclease signature motif containing protein [Terriglobia bacterium]|jgi:hypothetical protein